MLFKFKRFFVFLFICATFLSSLCIKDCEALSPPINYVKANIDTAKKIVTIFIDTTNYNKDFEVTVTNPEGKINYSGVVSSGPSGGNSVTYVNKDLTYGKYNVVAENKELNIKYSSDFYYYVYGDVTHDGIADSADYTTLRKYLLENITEFPEPEWKITADLNRDKIIDTADYAILRRKLLGIITDIPVLSMEFDVLKWRTKTEYNIDYVELTIEGTTNADSLTIANPSPGSPPYDISVDSLGKFKGSFILYSGSSSTSAKPSSLGVSINAMAKGIKSAYFHIDSGTLKFDNELTAEQQQAIAALRKESSKFFGFFERQEEIIRGNLPKDQKRITLEEVKQIIAKKQNFLTILNDIKSIHGAPDLVGGSGVTLNEFWLNEDGSEKIVVTLELKNIVYSKTGENSENLYKEKY